MKKLIILTSAFSVLAMALVSCASKEAETTTTRETTVTTPPATTTTTTTHRTGY